MSRVLIVDDESSVLDAFTNLLRKVGHDVETAGRAETALEQVRRSPPDVVVSDLCLPEMDGMEMFRRIRDEHSRLPVILMTGFGTMETAIEATKLGAFDYQLKPVDPAAMLDTISRALESVRLMQRNVEFNPGKAESNRDAIIGSNAKMQEVFKSIGRVAATDATVLIRGESGTGKELVARAIYQHSRRSSSPLLCVNCAAIPEPLLESELFGYERGAFTGATSRKIGKFEQAHGGTILLDEIGDISLGVQAKLLRVLQARQFQRVGSNETLQVDVRVLAATNRNLERALSEGTFREDLFYRLNVLTINLPALRERTTDIPQLVDYFLDRYAMELELTKPVLADDAMSALCTYPWPGNVRELEHCVYRAMIFTQGYPIQLGDVTRARQESSSTVVATEIDDQHLTEFVASFLDKYRGSNPHEHLIDRVERAILLEALKRNHGNQTRAAKQLGISRPSLHAKLRRYGIPASDKDAPSES